MSGRSGLLVCMSMLNNFFGCHAYAASSEGAFEDKLSGGPDSRVELKGAAAVQFDESMQIQVLGCGGGESSETQLTALRINECLALDAGSLTRVLSLEEQLTLRSVVLSHSHIDHTNGLPFFVENIYGVMDQPLDIYAGAATIEGLRSHIFNSTTWPDFSRLPTELLPSVRFHELVAGVEIELQGVGLTPIPMNHPVPTFGFLIRGDAGSILWSSDTGPTSKFWEIANATPNLKAVCIETSFDNALQSLADVSGHLTPRTLELELAKLERKVPVLLHHLKPPCAARVKSEVRMLKNSDLSFLEQGETYNFS